LDSVIIKVHRIMALEIEDVGIQNQVCEDDLLTDFTISLRYAFKAFLFATSIT